MGLDVLLTIVVAAGLIVLFGVALRAMARSWPDTPKGTGYHLEHPEEMRDPGRRDAPP